ncbi:MAG TPA: HAD-IB family phosphatase [Candidatus Paceibacterota bacterium]|jgi:HAD superfamily hydrolase (TIGR01490 family)|nr:HAD-IB family phosphatase [Candidatus Paceibacterota bacterium]
MAMERKVAVFDVDGTIFRSSLLIQVVDALIESGAFPQETRQVYEREYMKWLDREGDYGSYIEAVVKAFRAHLKEVHYRALVEAADKVVELQWKRTYRYTRDLIKELKAKDYFLLAVSHSPKTVLDKFCPKIGFDKAYGIIYEIGPQDLFTGNVVDEHLIYNKANIVKRAIDKEGLTLDDSVGVGDTESDIPFLELVARAICFNPNMKLYKNAKRLDWEVKVERKDVVYDIQ